MSGNDYCKAQNEVAICSILREQEQQTSHENLKKPSNRNVLISSEDQLSSSSACAADGRCGFHTFGISFWKIGRQLGRLCCPTQGLCSRATTATQKVSLRPKRAKSMACSSTLSNSIAKQRTHGTFRQCQRKTSSARVGPDSATRAHTPATTDATRFSLSGAQCGPRLVVHVVSSICFLPSRFARSIGAATLQGTYFMSPPNW